MKYNILIVEDETEICDAIEIYLNQLLYFIIKGRMKILPLIIKYNIFTLIDLARHKFMRSAIKVSNF